MYQGNASLNVARNGSQGGSEMKITLSNNVVITLTKEKAQALKDEMRYAVHNVSVLPVMEELLQVMEA